MEDDGDDKRRWMMTEDDFRFEGQLMGIIRRFN